MNDREFNEFCERIEPGGWVQASGGTVRMRNTRGDAFTVGLSDLKSMLSRWLERNDAIRKLIADDPRVNPTKDPWDYQEKPYRQVFKTQFPEPSFAAIRALGKSQTRALMNAVTKYVGYTIDNPDCRIDDRLLIDATSLTEFFRREAAPFPESIAPEVRAAFVAVCQFCEDYNRKPALPVGHPDLESVSTNLEILRLWLLAEVSNHAGVAMDVQASTGAGWFPRVPWVVVLPPGQKVTNGIYVAMCFGREGAGAVVGCAESLANRQGLQTVKRSEQADLRIDLKSNPGTNYNDVFENPVEVGRADFDPRAVADHVRISLDFALEHLGLTPPTVAPQRLRDEARKIVRAFAGYADALGFKFEEAAIRSYVTSLAAKPFVILTGTTGTGKSQLALMFARWIAGDRIGAYRMIPVGADWTDNRSIVGFLNLLRATKDHPGVFQTTEVLNLLMEADKNSSQPYFLILDEMNLSHVERYFADFLSAMESDEAVPLHSEEDAVPSSSGTMVLPTIRVPKNVFITGTVNVDETTYMFSPKVLDRAFVLETGVDVAAMRAVLAGAIGSKPEPTDADIAMSDGFLRLSLLARGLKPFSGAEYPRLEEPKDMPRLRDTLAGLAELLMLRNAEYGYRAGTEMRRYAMVDFELTGESWTWNGCLDRLLLQKVLPKLHGSRRRLEPTLVALAQFCLACDLESARAELAADANPSAFAPPMEKGLLPHSYAKVVRMLEAVRREQFTSFIQ